MRFVFVSNYINHHQKPFCDALYEKLGDEFAFVQTMPMEEERVAMGWDTSLAKLPYVKLLYEDEYEAKKIIAESECVLFGWSEREDIAQSRLDSGKPTLRVSERLYRDGRYKAISPKGLVAKYHEHIKYRNKPVYMLCAGAYTAADFSLIHAYPNKLLKWGYYPPLEVFSDSDFANLKTNPKEEIDIIWAGRFIPLKHAEFAIKLAKAIKEDLKKNKFADAAIRIHMVGSGELEDELKNLAKELHVEDMIKWYGFLKPQEVRALMNKCHIHLCTSNQLEGWGAVVSEGMNAGCIEVVSDRMGAVPFLINNGVNGLSYSKDSYKEFEGLALEAIHGLINCDEKYVNMGKLAYESIYEEWNALTAAERLLALIDELIDAYHNNRVANVCLPTNGPLSAAQILKL